MLQDKINTSKDRLAKLTKEFVQAVGARAGATGHPISQAEAAQQLRQMAAEHSNHIRCEIPVLLNISKISRERASLLLRYHSPIVGDEVYTASGLIRTDINHADRIDDMAASMLKSAETFTPLPAGDLARIEETIKASFDETNRLHDGIIHCMKVGPLTPEQERELHRFYESPDDPLQA